MKNNMYFHEKKLQIQGYKKIAGMDEVGRGCWAGPLVVAACILPSGYKNDEINDSKKLSAKKREKLFDIICHDALGYEIIFMSPEEVDHFNPKEATSIAMSQALKKLHPKPDFCLIDAEKVESEIETKSFPKGDSNSISIAAASILAKVTRDRYMINLSVKYPEYHFDKHKGYGTEIHAKALKKHGPIKGVHRFSYKPVQKVILEQSSDKV